EKTEGKETKNGNDKVNGHAKASNGRGASAAPPIQVLLVEDEILVGMAMRDLLTDLGYSVLGPYGDVDEAIAAASNNRITAAVLDVNLAGTPVYPLADELRSRKVP